MLEHMTNTLQVRKNYKFRLYRCDKKDALRRRSVRHLREKLFVASLIWNHFIALQKRYYRLTGKYISLHEMNRHVLKLRRRVRFARWKHLHSQSCQDVCRRIDAGYQRFFDKLAAHPPKFRKAKKYRSFTFPQSGYKVEGNTISIDGRKYRFVKHREIGGRVKTLTVKRDAVGRLWLVFSVVENIAVSETSTGKSGGFDFGLKTFLTDDDGRAHSSPLFYACTLAKTRKLHKALARKVAGSKRYKRARRTLAKQSAHVAKTGPSFQTGAPALPRVRHALPRRPEPRWDESAVGTQGERPRLCQFRDDPQVGRPQTRQAGHPNLPLHAYHAGLFRV